LHIKRSGAFKVSVFFSLFFLFFKTKMTSCTTSYSSLPSCFLMLQVLKPQQWPSCSSLWLVLFFIAQHVKPGWWMQIIFLIIFLCSKL
jgi:hypothetical protein